MNFKLVLMLIVVGFVGTLGVIPLIKGLLIDSGCIRPNYRRESIPVAMGLCFIPMVVINTILVQLLFPESISADNFVYLFAVFSMLLAGLIDDLIGTTDVKGLKGHFKALFKGRLTTGGLKALLGGFVGIVASIYAGGSIYEILLGAIIIALSTNLMNLLDLRPGRAIKVYLLIIVVFFIAIPDSVIYLSLYLFPCVLAYFYMDLKAKAMMGDTGSNVLGITIGIICVFGMEMWQKALFAILLIAIHIITEKYSLTEIIEKNNFLNKIDMLGRD